MAKGGRRFGAGRPVSKQKAELNCSLDIRALQRGGYLERRYPFSWVWRTNHGDESGSATIRVSDEYLRLSYSWKGRDFDNTLAFIKTPCHFGGVRLWFQCPQCGGRCAKMFFNRRNGRYACRLCVGITYYSQCEDEMDRAWRKQKKLERKLGEYLMKPKGMHQITHTAIIRQIRACEEHRDLLLFSYAKRLGLLKGLRLKS